MNVVQRVIELRPLVSAILEAPKVIMCVPWSFLLTVVRNPIQRSAVLTVVSGYDANHMGIWCHETTTRGGTRLESVVLGVELCIAR